MMGTDLTTETTRILAQELPAGRFSEWLATTQQALSEGDAVDVPCDTCTACCQSRYFVHIGPDETETLQAIPAELLVPAPRQREGHMMLGYDESGTCPMLENGRCTIYTQRPRTCRQYDCRVFAAAGLQAGGDDKAAVNEQVHRWRFDEINSDDVEQRLAVASAARYLMENQQSLPGGSGLANPIQLALSAIKIHHLFLPEVAIRDQALAGAVASALE